MTAQNQNKSLKNRPYKGLLEEHELHTASERKKNTQKLKQIHQDNLKKIQKK